MQASPGSPVAVQCFTAQTADETLGPWVNVFGKQNVAFFITGSGTTSGGVISFEEAAPKDVSTQSPPVFGADTGDYSVVTTVNASDVTSDAQKAVHLTPAAYYFVRARISAAITGGGNITVNCVAN